MSVIGYGKRDILDMLAATWHRGSAGSSDAKSYMVRLAQEATSVMVANHAAYVETYGPERSGTLEEPITAAEINSALVRATVDSNRNGLRTLAGLRYNLVSNDGRDFASVDDLDFLLRLTAAELESS